MIVNKAILSPEQLCVFQLIERCNERITQLEIMRSESWLGSHPEEKHLNINHQQTTLRKIRQIIRTLRIKYKCPILSDKKGYWIPKSEAEVKEYIARTEKMAIAQGKAWLETYRCMKENFNGINSNYFDLQLSLNL